ncbi:metalloregulator ArsR/SmtB family transcription factor [Streptomyces sp. NBC_00846]|uniref:ArsR/SmtB family transcription factor n=1 Tax=Streptomyces sp. NBC_00846 TaxID=2975849 RepID=UPI00386D28B0|nr:metalloregulator ArsR/SmtB family transcription factor [Streptomyces sp. NBC_00846]
MRREDPPSPEGELQLSAADLVWWTGVFKALGDPVRLQLLIHLAALRGGPEVPVHEISDVGVSQPTVSHHLKRLREMGLVGCRREGRIVYYFLGPEVRSILMQILHREQAEAGKWPAVRQAQGAGPAPL